MISHSRLSTAYAAEDETASVIDDDELGIALQKKLDEVVDADIAGTNIGDDDADDSQCELLSSSVAQMGRRPELQGAVPGMDAPFNSHKEITFEDAYDSGLSQPRRESALMPIIIIDRYRQPVRVLFSGVLISP